MKVGVHEPRRIVQGKNPGLWTAEGRYGWRMRWHDLFDDLEAQLMRADREAFEDEVRERTGGERAAITLGALLAASEGTSVRATLSDGSHVEGTVTDCAAQWLCVSDRGREWLVPAAAISALDGAPTGAPEPGVVAARLTLGHVLRALLEDGEQVVVSARGAQARGRITAVGADHLVLDARKVVPFAAILSVSPAL